MLLTVRCDDRACPLSQQTTLPEIMKRGRDVAVTVRRAARSKVVRAVTETVTAQGANGSTVSDPDDTIVSVDDGSSAVSVICVSKRTPLT